MTPKVQPTPGVMLKIHREQKALLSELVQLEQQLAELEARTSVHKTVIRATKFSSPK